MNRASHDYGRDYVRDYGRAGRLAVATPQANPTVEAEMRRLFPPDVEYYTVRLTSKAGDGRRRLCDYAERLPDIVEDFAGMPLDGLLFACTGSSYLLPPVRLAELRDTAERRLGAPVWFAADAIRAWLDEHGYRRLALLTPYPDWLNDAACAWWREAGYGIAGAVQVDIGSDDLTAIYDQQSASASESLEAWLAIDADAWVVSGTGMPSLPILAKLHATGRPVMSSTLALAVCGLATLGREPVASERWQLT